MPVVTEDTIPIVRELAGFGNRFLAFVLDLVVVFLTIGLLVLAFGALNRQVDWFRWLSDYATTVAILITLIPLFLYPWCCEWATQGQTLGKRVLRIRVVRQNGQPVGFYESLGRNLVRILDVGLMGIGLLVMMANPTERRLGDWLCGTLVVADRKAPLPPELADTPTADLGLSPLNPWSRHTFPALTPESQRLIQAYLRRRRHLLKRRRTLLDREFFRYLQPRLSLPDTLPVPEIFPLLEALAVAPVLPSDV